jgi:RNA polymerase sigma-70 factor (ECF subfamily)
MQPPATKWLPCPAENPTAKTPAPAHFTQLGEGRGDYHSSPMSRSQSLNFKKLVEIYHASLYRFAYSLANDEQIACDLTQHTFFIYANKGSQAIGNPAKLKPWLFTTLYHEYLRQRHAPRLGPATPARKKPAGPVPLVTLDGESAAQMLEQIEETHRAPLVLFYLRELSFREIAEVLNLTVAEVLNHIALGKTKLQQITADLPPGV